MVLEFSLLLVSKKTVWYIGTSHKVDYLPPLSLEYPHPVLYIFGRIRPPGGNTFLIAAFSH